MGSTPCALLPRKHSTERRRKCRKAGTACCHSHPPPKTINHPQPSPLKWKKSESPRRTSLVSHSHPRRMLWRVGRLNRSFWSSVNTLMQSAGRARPGEPHGAWRAAAGQQSSRWRHRQASRKRGSRGKPTRTVWEAEVLHQQPVHRASVWQHARQIAFLAPAAGRTQRSRLNNALFQQAAAPQPAAA